MNSSEWEILIRTRDRLTSAAHGQKGDVIAQACRELGCGEQAVYRKLEAAGLDTGRKVRKDKGLASYTREQLMLVSGVLIASTRGNDKRLLTVEDAIEILHANGRLPCKLSPGWVSQLLRDATLHPDQLSHQTPATAMRSLHPNHCWQIDASVCVLYYIKGGALTSMPKDEFYKNKPHNLAKVVNDLAIRMACTDHYSGTIWTRYYTGGETAENLIEFFLWCVTQRDGCPAHGVPWMVMLDPGAANKSHLFKQLCDRLQVKLQINKPGNARAKGQVENAHNLIERHFEGRLRFMPELDLDGLNALCERWQAAHNSGRKHSRHGQPRYSMWMAITPEQLRIAPPLQMMRDLVTTAEETRRVSNAMTVSYSVKGYGSADYSVAYVPGALAGQTVKVCVNPYRAPAIDVQYVDKATGEISWVCIEPIKLNAAGFQADAPVIGEQHKALPHTVADKARGELLMQAQNVSTLEEAEKARKRHAQAYAGHLDAMADVDATPVPAYLPRRGTALETEKRAVAAVRLTVVEGMKRLKPLLGDYPAKDAYAWLQARFGEEGVPEDQLEAIAAQITGVELRQADAALREENADAPLPALRLVGGAR